MELSPTIRHETVGPVDSPHRMRIVHLSDLHLWFSDRKLRRLEPIIAQWSPDVIALTGDYADTPVGRRLAISWIDQIAAEYHVCWVAGNHDRWWGNSFLQRIEGLRLAHPIDRGDAWITIRGGGRYRFTSWDRLSRARSSVTPSGPCVVLLHDPTVIRLEQLPDEGDYLLLAGHLHGGQINLWQDRMGRPQPASMCYNWLVDRGVVGRTPLVVSRGLGDTLPVRIRAPREVVVIDYYARAGVGD